MFIFDKTLGHEHGISDKNRKMSQTWLWFSALVIESLMFRDWEGAKDLGETCIGGIIDVPVQIMRVDLAW